MSQGSDKRSVSTDALDTLGTIFTTPQGRDAIHLAVEPVEATCTLLPGQHITIQDQKAYPAGPIESLGIVDPFVQETIQKGQKFWFIMKPRQVRSLRHVWSHPAFPEAK